MKLLAILFFTFFVYFSTEQDADWSGEVCSEVQTRTNYTEVCVKWGPFWCDVFANETSEYNVTVYYCCPGWSHTGNQNCSIPVCTSSCLNGGTCVNPNTCACPAGYEGTVCQTVSPCSHLKPCFPGSCGGSPKQCICSTGFSGTSCLQLTNAFRPILHGANSTVRYDDTSGNTLYTYSVSSRSAETVTWSNQNQYNRIELSIEASFDTNATIGAIPALPDYISQLSFGVMQAGVTFLYTEATGSSDFDVQCPGLTEPVQYLPCVIAFPLSPTFDVNSGDVFAITHRATSGGRRRLKNPDTGMIITAETYSGHSVETILEFRFDFEVPTHCSQNTTCTNNAMSLEDDTTMSAIKPYWSGWSDALSGVYRYSFEVWKLEYDAINDGFREPQITATSNPEPIFMAEILATNTSYPVFTPSSRGVYSCILEINDRANNSEYVRRIVVYDGQPEITLALSKDLYVSSASSATNYLWQTKYNLESSTTINVTWDGLFANPSHVDDHFLSKVLDYEPRLSDGINRHNYKRILSIFNDNEGSRTVASIPHIRGIVKYEMLHEIISKPKTVPPEFGWVVVSPLVELSSFTMASYTIGDGDSHQVWIRAWDVVSGNMTVTTVIHFDKTGPSNHLTNVLRNVNDGVHQFTSRINAISQDLHSGVKNVTFQVVLNSTAEVRYQTVVTVTNETAEDCQLTPDCYCVPMGLCFTRTMSFDFDNCLLQVPQELVNTGVYSLHVTSYNTALLPTTTVHNIGSVLLFNGINIYPSPSSATISNRTNTDITVAWVTPATCYTIRQFVLFLHRTGNDSLMFTVEKENRTLRISGLSPGAEYTIDLYTEYGNDTYVARSLVPLTVDFETATYCSHLQPCYPGSCLSYTDSCTCSNGLMGTSCLFFDAQYKPTIVHSNATISFLDSGTGETSYTYSGEGEITNITWSNQPSYNSFNLELDAHFRYLDVFGAVPSFPLYVNNASFGIVEGKVRFDHVRSGSVVTSTLFTCPQASARNPVEELTCKINDNTAVDVLSGDRFVFTFVTTSGGFLELLRINDRSITGTEYYNGSSTTIKIIFQFDFDVPVHCSVTLSCTDSPMRLEQDVTKNAIRPYWSGWFDRISGITKYTFEIWRLEYNGTLKKLHEPMVTVTDSPVPLYKITNGPGNNIQPEFTPSEPGMYSCILEIRDNANNAEYVRRVVLYDPFSDVSINQSNQISVTSASPSTNYQWVTDFNPSTANQISLQWKGLFENKMHEDEKFLSEIGTFERNNKQMLTRFDDYEGNRTLSAIDNIHGIVRFQYNYDVVSRPSTSIPAHGWENMQPINDSVTLEMASGVIGDGDTQQFWIRAFDILNNSKTQTAVVFYDHSGPSNFLMNVELNVPSDESEFYSRITFESEDLHSGITNVSVIIGLDTTGELKYSNLFNVQSMKESDCNHIQDCYCIPMGQCFMRPITFQINNCDLVVHLNEIKDGNFLINITSTNKANLETMSTFQIGEVIAFSGISEYPSPRTSSVVYKSNSNVTIAWIDTPTCYEKIKYLITLHHPDNITESVMVDKELNMYTFSGLEPGSTYTVKIYTDYMFNGSLIRSPDPLTTSVSTESFCSHLMPCFPGQCRADVHDCVCSNSFHGDTCLDFDSTFEPVLTTSSAKIAFFNTTTSSDMFLYMVNSSRDGNVTWSNNAQYNVLEFNLSALFDDAGYFGTLPDYPDYIGNVSFGIVEGRFEFYHLRASTVIRYKSMQCSDASPDTPVSSLVCQATVDDSIIFESGDILRVIISIKSGGFRTLVNFANGDYINIEYYNGVTVKNQMEFRFDFDVPTHCSLASSCLDSPFKLQEDVTKTSIVPFWSGWTDSLSGVNRFNFKVWKLDYKPDLNGLQEPPITSTENPEPVYIASFNAYSIYSFPTYTPSQPGVYSCILEINDNANNSEYVRRIVVFDDTSIINVNSSNELQVLSASETTEYKWITEFQPPLSTTLTLSWTGVFMNELHDENDFLEKVLDYSPRLNNGIEHHNFKRILKQFDDYEGQRTVEAVSNIHGIVRFDTVYEVVSVVKTIAPSIGWTSVVPLNTSSSIVMDADSVLDGDILQLWVRAYDIMGNSNTLSTVVYLDHSSPEIYLSDINYQPSGASITFGTRISLIVQDLHSGIENIAIEVVLNATNEVKHNISIPLTVKQSCKSSPDCYCIPTGRCYLRTYPFDIDNCLLKVALDLIQDGAYTLNITVVNGAALKTTSEFGIGRVGQFSGINTYPSPASLTITNITNSGVTFRWIPEQTCYTLERFLVNISGNNRSNVSYINKDMETFSFTNLLPGTEYTIEMYAVYENNFTSPEPRSIRSYTESYCSHKMPCYPGTCFNDRPGCTCVAGFYGDTCLKFSDGFKPVILNATAIISSKDKVNGLSAYTYRANIENDTVWLNQAEFSSITMHIQAEFDLDKLFVRLPEFPKFVKNATYGIIKGEVEVHHLSNNGSEKVLSSCDEPNKAEPIKVLKCHLVINKAYRFSSQDMLTITFTVLIGGNRQIINYVTNDIFDVQLFNGSSVSEELRFLFDFDMPSHCSSLGTCDVSPLFLTEDVTRNAIIPYWSGWTDSLSGVYRYSYEIWKLNYNESESGFQEPFTTTNNNPVPLFTYETMATNPTFSQFEPTESGMYSCILEVRDKANNSAFVRRIILHDKTSDVSLNASSQIFVSSALPDTNNLWQTDFDPDDITVIKISWYGLFANYHHVNNYLLSKVLSYEPRISDNGNRKWIPSGYDDFEGNRTINEVNNINGIVRFEIGREVVIRRKSNPPQNGWSVVSPLSENATIDIEAFTVGDGGTMQIWIKAFDILNNSRWESAIVHLDHTGPNIFMSQLEHPSSSIYPFTSRLKLVAVDYHSGCTNTSIRFVLKDTGDIRYEANDTIITETKSICDKSSDCYCVQMGLCFRRTQIFDMDSCLLGVPLDLIESGRYSVEVMSYNSATLKSEISTEIRIKDIPGINHYPAPSAVSFLNKTNTAIIMKWTETPTCYTVTSHVVYLFTPNNATREFRIMPNASDVTIADLSPGVSYSIEMYTEYTEYGNASRVIRSLDSYHVEFETSDSDQVVDDSERNWIPVIVGSIVGFILLVALTVLFVVWLLKRRHRNLCVGPISEPDVVNDASKKPMVKASPTLSKKLSRSSAILAVPESPSLERADKNAKSNIFDMNLPKGRAKTLPPLPPISSTMSQNHK